MVWDFAERTGGRTTLTDSFTREFEEALVQTGGYNVLERRNFPRLQAVIANERALSEVGQISSPGLASLKGEGATGVLFGEVFDDVDSGEASVTVTLQEFSGRQPLIKSVLMRRGLLSDARSRRESMGELARSLSATTRATVARVQANGFIFDLRGCQRAERSVGCQLLVTNNGEDRELYIITEFRNGARVGSTYLGGDRSTRVYDESSNVTAVARVMLANDSADAGDAVAAHAFLLSGRPANATLRFDGVSSRSATIARLDITCYEEEGKSEFTVTFRNQPVD